MQNNTTPFSVLMAVYIKESPERLRRALESVFEQTLKPNEVVLVKDGPLTGELNMVVNDFKSKYAILKVVPLKENHGLGYALNEGLQHCSFNLVARMDSDDVSKPNRFEVQMKYMSEHKDVDVCGTWLEEFEDDIHLSTSIKKVPVEHNDIKKYAKKRNPINHPTVVYKKDKVLSLGGYDGFPEDLYLWIKLLMHGCKFHNIGMVLYSQYFSLEAVKRRGTYLKYDIKAQNDFYKIGFINKMEYLRNVAIRVGVRIMPDSIRAYIYKNIIRKYF